MGLSHTSVITVCCDAEILSFIEGETTVITGIATWIAIRDGEDDRLFG